MIRIALFACVTVAVSAAVMIDALGSAPVLPYYDSPDLTPRWRPVGHRIADFDLLTQTGESIRRSDLEGRVHVATFIYTRCAGVCPAMVTQLKKVQKAIAGRADTVLVSFSVTPQHDTPQTLAAFADERDIAASQWKLVTGDAGQIYDLARASYFADDGRLERGKPAVEQFLHTEKALLVDRDGRLRGVYNATLPHEIDKLLVDLDLILREDAP
jgi:protein SCO1/2